jgi:hypothetical protein
MGGESAISAAEETPPDYHLLLDPTEVPVASSALRLYMSDEAHEPEIQGLGREVLAGLAGVPDERGIVTVALTAKQMKITHAALRLLLNDLQRDQAAEREILWGVLGKLPDEHVMRAIML